MDIEKVRQALLSAKAYGVGAHLCDYDISEQDVIDVIDGLSKAMEWQTIDTAPLGVVVDTIIRDAGGSRNHQPLKASQRDPNCRVIWWFPDGSMYVYYTPTHWKPIQPTDRRTPEQAE